MKRFASFLLYPVLLSMFFSLAGCAGKKQAAVAEEPMKPVNSIVVLPVEIQKAEQGYDYITTRQLESGAAVLGELAKELLAGKNNIRFVSPSQKETLLGEFHGAPKAMTQRVGEQLGADAALLITAVRYSERDGGEYSVNQPASVSFKFQLFHVATGTSLCMGVFDETQQTLLSNLFSFSKASSRGFKWITARQLASEGMKEKINDCKHLSR